MDKFGEIRRVAETAKMAGVPKQERKRLVREPRAYIKTLLTPSPDAVDEEQNANLLENLSPSMVTAFLRAASGEKANERVLIALGNFLYDSVKTSTTSPLYGKRHELVVNYTEGEQQLLHLGVKFLERALYHGDLVHMHGPEAGVTAFVVNRLAKVIRPLSQETNDRGGAHDTFEFDEKRFAAFADRVTDFAKRYYSPNGIRNGLLEVYREEDRLLSDTLGETHADVVALSDIEEHFAYIPSKIPEKIARNVNASIDAFRERVGACIDQESALDVDMAIRWPLREIDNALGELDAEMILSKSLADEPLLHSTYDIHGIINNLKELVPAQNPFRPILERGQKISLAELQAQLLAAERQKRIDLFNEWQNASFVAEPLKSIVQEIRSLQRQRETVLDRVHKIIPETDKAVLAELRKTEQRWRDAASGNQRYLKNFFASRDVVLQRRSGLYFLKTFLAAADTDAAQPITEGPLTNAVSYAPEHSAIHNFNLPSESRDVLKIHFWDEELPFARMAVKAMKEKYPPKSRVQTGSFSLEPKTTD